MVKITKLLKEDIPFVVFLEEKYLGETLGEEMISSELNSDVTKFLVAKIDDQVVGALSCYQFLDEVELLNFVVDEKYQRQGIGQALFDQMINEAKQVKKITLEVRKSNIKALNFYTKNGFRIISKRKNYYKNGEDALVLLKEFV